RILVVIVISEAFIEDAGGHPEAVRQRNPKLRSDRIPPCGGVRTGVVAEACEASPRLVGFSDRNPTGHSKFDRLSPPHRHHADQNREISPHTLKTRTEAISTTAPSLFDPQ